MNAFTPCHGEAENLFRIIIELGEVVPPALTNPTPLNIANLHSELQELWAFVINTNFEVDPTEILSILELAIVSTEVTPFSVISVGTNLQQLLEQLLAYVLVLHIAPACKDVMVGQIRPIQVSISLALGLYDGYGQTGLAGPTGPYGVGATGEAWFYIKCLIIRRDCLSDTFNNSSNKYNDYTIKLSRNSHGKLVSPQNRLYVWLRGLFL